MKISDHIKEDTTAEFMFYRSGELWYKLSTGLEFAVPITDCDDAVFSAKEKGIFFMKWVRKAVQAQAEHEANVVKWREDWAKEQAQIEMEEAALDQGTYEPKG